jgi:pilus assembly protein FimV
VAPSAPLPGSYGEVERGETLWGITRSLRPSGVTMNQMMVAIYEANPQAFNANMNILRRGAILRIPELNEIEALDTRAATAEVQQHTDTWQGRVADQEPRLILVPPSDDISVAALDSGNADSAATDATSAADETASSTAVEPGDRLLDVENSELAALQDSVGAGAEEAAVPPAAGADPGVELESESVFADEPAVAGQEPAPEPAVTEPAVAPRPAPAARAEPTLLETILGWVAMPIVWIAAGAVVVVVGLLLFLRRRGRAEPEDVTGKWEALEAELDDDVAREATARLRRQAQDEDFVVQEQPAEPEPPAPPAAAPAPAPAKKTRASAASAAAAAAKEPEPADQTLSSQTVINLDQADPIAEADFHMAYGLYDQAADLVAKAVQAQPKRRDLKLKLLEVFFVWGNKESFLKTAKGLREEIGARPDADWDKVVIMGKQICPDEPLFAAATRAAAEVDVDLEAGDAPALDLSFDADEGTAAGAGVDLDLGAGLDDLSLAQSGARAQTKPAAPAKPAGGGLNVDLDIGTRTQAGLEAALLELDEKASQTTPDLEDALAATQESPTAETPRSGFDDWSAVTMESPTVESEAPETVEQSALRESPTMETPTVESTGLRGKSAETSGEFTAELNLDDLGLDVDDIKDLPQNLGDAASGEEESDTREQLQVGIESDLLSATGVTQVLHEEDPEIEHSSTAILSDSDATMLAPGFDGDGTVRTEVIERPIETMVPPAKRKSDLDLDLDDFSAALHGGDTVEQPHPQSLETGIFQSGGSTPIDLDIGADVRGDDEPTGTEEVGSVDPQTLTEVGTKLDLARAYIDMGDPEGARSILEEVLGEGDPGQRREAQTLIDALPA